MIYPRSNVKNSRIDSLPILRVLWVISCDLTSRYLRGKCSIRNCHLGSSWCWVSKTTPLETYRWCHGHLSIVIYSLWRWPRTLKGSVTDMETEWKLNEAFPLPPTLIYFFNQKFFPKTFHLSLLTVSSPGLQYNYSGGLLGHTYFTTRCWKP